MRRNESFRISGDEDKIAFRRPLKIRIFGAVSGLVIAGMLPAVIAVLSSDSQHSVPMSTISWFLFTYLELACLGLSAVAFSGAGPEDLFLDINRHTYRFVFGWPFWPQVREGPWEDMAGIYLWQHPSNGAYYVGLAWKGNAMRLPLLGMRGIRPTWLGKFDGLGRWRRAEQFAAETAAAVDLPLVEPPFLKVRQGH